MPFKIGNPGGPGRPTNQQVLHVRALARQHRASAIATLAEIMTDASVDPRARIMAANAMLDRDVGKPVERAQVQVSSNRSPRDLSIAELEAALARAEASGSAPTN